MPVQARPALPVTGTRLLARPADRHPAGSVGQRPTRVEPSVDRVSPPSDSTPSSHRTASRVSALHRSSIAAMSSGPVWGIGGNPPVPPRRILPTGPPPALPVQGRSARCRSAPPGRLRPRAIAVGVRAGVIGLSTVYLACPAGALHTVHLACPHGALPQGLGRSPQDHSGAIGLSRLHLACPRCSSPVQRRDPPTRCDGPVHPM